MITNFSIALNSLKIGLFDSILRHYSNDRPYIIVHVSENQSSTVFGEVPFTIRSQIINSISTESYTEVDDGIYRMILEDRIYLFKKIKTVGSEVYIGLSVEKSVDNRISTMDLQTQHCLRKVGMVEHGFGYI